MAELTLITELTHHHHHHHHRLTAVLSRQTRVSRFPPYHPSPPITVISILNNKAQWLHIHLDGVHPCFLGSSFGFPSFYFQHSTPFYPIIIRPPLYMSKPTQPVSPYHFNYRLYTKTIPQLNVRLPLP